MVTVTLIKTVKDAPDESYALEKVGSLIPDYVKKQFVSCIDIREIIPSNLIKSENLEP